VPMRFVFKIFDRNERRCCNPDVSTHHGDSGIYSIKENIIHSRKTEHDTYAIHVDVISICSWRQGVVRMPANVNIKGVEGFVHDRDRSTSVVDLARLKGWTPLSTLSVTRNYYARRG
jgi:hypothetical protein